MYNEQSLHHLPGVALFEVIAELHAALIGLLWQIDDLKNFDEGMWESHFDDTVPLYRAEEIHRLLLTDSIKQIYERGYLAEYRGEFARWWDRCRVGDSLPVDVRAVLPKRPLAMVNPHIAASEGGA